MNGPAAISAVIPTRNRQGALARMLESLLGQETVPAELLIVDASTTDATEKLAQSFAARFAKRGCTLTWFAAKSTGAAVQRNQGLALVSQPTIAFFDDDILFEEHCLGRLYRALQSDSKLGGVNAMIINQRYQSPGRVSRLMFRIMAGHSQKSYAGRLLGPAINLLPEDNAGLPEVVPAEWLNTTCTLYRREALPEPAFAPFFTGYSMMEDVALSVRVGCDWKLANARTARIYHDSQAADYKSDLAALARLELLNRHYVMTEILGRRRARDYGKLALWEVFQLSTCALQKRFGREFRQRLKGKCQGVAAIVVGASKKSPGQCAPH